MRIIKLSEVRSEDHDIAGGKGANLGELIHQGFPVPPGFVVPTDIYAEFIGNFDPPGETNPENAISLCEVIRHKIVSTALPAELEAQIRHHHELVQQKYQNEIVYAVRSSATAEDLGDASFAGQHDTYYYVNITNLPMMVRKCWASLWSDAAFSYRQSHGIEHSEVKMAVIIQVMILSDVSGVTFTADPVSGAENVIITEASFGMGAAIVDGRVSPDQFIVNKATGKLTSKKIADKKFMVPAFLDQDEESRLREVPAHLRRTQSLTAKQIDTVTSWAKRSEEYFGSQQDIEWSFEGDEFFILQSRPITVMGEIEEVVPEGKYVLFKPMAENFTDPLLPLSQDLLISIFPMMKIIYGRAYMNLSHARAIVPLKITDEDLATIAYLGDIQDFKPRLSIPRLLGLSFIGFCFYLIFGVLFQRTDNMPDGFMDNFRRYFRDVVDDPNISAPEALTKLFFKTGFFEPVGNMVLLVNLASPRYIFLTILLNKLLKRWIPDLQEDAASLLTSGNEGILSTEMGREIWQLARTVRLDPGLTNTILETAPDKALALLQDQPEAEAFVDQLESFLEKHGHRTMKEFELNSVRWEEDPSPVIAMIRNYLLADSDPGASEARIELKRQVLEDGVSKGLAGLPLEKLLGWRAKIINGIRVKTKYFVKLRENSRFFHIMGFYAVRLKVLEAETELMDSGVLKCKDDIFYLSWPQVEDLQSGIVKWVDVEGLIRSRRINHIRLSKLRAPKTIGVEIKAKPEATSSDHELRGQAASPGLYRGIARVIMDPATDAEIKPGEILIAPYTDPAWTPLFLIANAAVIEVGSYLSHAGTIAREYGMPCVVDVADCTNHIASGDLIEVDGSSGTVRLIDKQSALNPEGGST